jgi:hypothetical protein
LSSRFYLYLYLSDLKTVHKAFLMSLYSLLRLSSSWPAFRKELSVGADLFTKHGQLQYPAFHHLLSNQTKQRILSYQFGSRMWIYFATLVNFATLWKRERERASEEVKPRECQISLIDRVGNIEGHVRCISLLGFNNLSWHTSWGGNDSRKGRRVLWRKILVGIFDTQLYLLARSIEELYGYNKLLSLKYFLFYGRLGKRVLSR